MNNEIICEFCRTSFKTISNLSNHKRTAKYCLELRNKTNQEFNCKYCNKYFSTKNWYEIHIKKCVHALDFYKDQNLKYDKDIEKLNQKIKYQEIQIQEKDKQITDLQNKIENIAIKAATKPTHIQNNNQRINQIVNNLIPITDEHLKQQAEYLTIDHIKNGASGYVQYALDYPLKDRVVCTDYSRRKIKYKDEKGDIVDDPEMTKLTQQLFKAIEEKNTLLINEYLEEIQRKYSAVISNSGNDLDDDEAENFSCSLDFLIDDLLKYKHQKIDLIDTATGKKSDLYYEFIKDICSKLCN